MTDTVRTFVVVVMMYAPANTFYMEGPVCESESTIPPCSVTDAHTAATTDTWRTNLSVSGKVHRVILLSPHAQYYNRPDLYNSEDHSIQTMTLSEVFERSSGVRVAIVRSPDLKPIFESMIESMGMRPGSIEFVYMTENDSRRHDPPPATTSLIVTTTLLEPDFRLGTFVDYADDIQWDVVRLRAPYIRLEQADVSKYSSHFVTSNLITFDELLQCRGGHSIHFLSDSFTQSDRSLANARLAMNMDDPLHKHPDRVLPLHRDEVPRMISKVPQPYILTRADGKIPADFLVDSYIRLWDAKFREFDMRSFKVHSSSLPGVVAGDRVILRSQLHPLENGRYFVMAVMDDNPVVRKQRSHHVYELKSAIELVDIDSVFISQLEDKERWSAMDEEKTTFQSLGESSIDITLKKDEEPAWPIRKGRWIHDGDVFIGRSKSGESMPHRAMVTVIHSNRPVTLRVTTLLSPNTTTSEASAVHQEDEKKRQRCTYHSDCPYFMSNPNYKNYRGGCYINGTCEMPIGWSIGEVKVHSSSSSMMTAPRQNDYAFTNDQLERHWGGIQWRS